MATKYLKRTALTASTTAEIAVAPADKGLTVHINVVNRGDNPRTVRLHIGTSSTAAVEDYFEYDADVVKGKPLVRWPVVLPPTYKIYARVDGADCNAVAWGEESINT